MALLRLTGTYNGFENFKIALAPLTADLPVIQDIANKLKEVELAAKKDTCDLHYMIQEMVKIHRVAKKEGNEALASMTLNSLQTIGLEVTEDGWGFKGENPEPITINATLVNFKE